MSYFVIFSSIHTNKFRNYWSCQKVKYDFFFHFNLSKVSFLHRFFIIIIIFQFSFSLLFLLIFISCCWLLFSLCLLDFFHGKANQKIMHVNPSCPVHFWELYWNKNFKLNFYFHISLWCLKRFYEGLHKNLTHFFSSSGIGTVGDNNHKIKQAV